MGADHEYQVSFLNIFYRLKIIASGSFDILADHDSMLLHFFRTEAKNNLKKDMPSCR